MALQSHPELQQWSRASTGLHPSVIGCRLLPWDRMWLGAAWLSSVEEIPKVAESRERSWGNHSVIPERRPGQHHTLLRGSLPECLCGLTHHLLMTCKS